LASPASTTNYRVVITDVNGCNTEKVVTIVVAAALNINAGTDVTTCIGTPVTLNATGADTYLWSPPNGLSCTDCPNPALQVSSSNVTYTVTGFRGNCVAQDQITVSPSIEHTIDFTAIKTGCSLVVTANVQGLASYKWDFGDGSTPATTANVTHVYKSSDTYNICLEVKGACNRVVKVCKVIKITDCNCETSNNGG